MRCPSRFGGSLALVIFAAGLPSFLLGQATPPSIMHLEGRLTSNTGVPENSAVKDIRVEFWDLLAGGTSLGTYTAVDPTITNGLYALAVTVPANVFANNAGVYLEISVGNGAVGADGVFETLSPRTRVLSAGYALNADTLDGLDSTSFASAATAFLQNGNSFGALATLGTNDANALAFEVGNSEKVRLQTDGTLSIGTTTDSGYALDVQGANQMVQIGSYLVLNSDGSGTVPNIRGNSGLLLSQGNTGYTLRLYSMTDTPSFPGTNAIVLQTNNAGAVATDRITISGKQNTATIAMMNSNVGIATTGPLSRLSVNAAGNADYASYFEGTSTNTGSTGVYAYQSGIAGNSAWSVYGARGVVNLTASTGGYYYGVRGDASRAAPAGDSRSYGVYGYAGNATTGYNYGAYGMLMGTGGGAGVFGSLVATGDVAITGQYAGYFAGNAALGGTAAAPELRIFEATGSGTNYSAFKAQAQALDVTYTLPAAVAGTNGYVLSSDTSGNLSWSDNMPASDADYIQNQSAGAQAADFWIANTARVDGNVTLGDTSGDTISLVNGANTAAETVNIASGATGANATVSILSGVGTAGAGTLSMANNTRVTTIDLGNVAPAAARITTVAGGNAAVNDTVNILAGAPSLGSQTVNILSGVATGGAQSLNLGTGGSAKTIAIGNTTGATALTLRTGTGNFSLDGVAGSTYAVGASTTTGTTTIGGTAQTGLITLGNSTGAGAVSIGVGTGAETILIGTAAGADVVTIGSVDATDGIALASTNGGAATIRIAGTGATVANTIQIGTAAVANAISIGSSSSDVSVTDAQWGITGAGAATFRASATVDTATATEDRIVMAAATGTLSAARLDGTLTNVDLTLNRTWTFPNATGTVLLNSTSGVVPLPGTAGRILYDDGVNWNTLAAGTSNQVLLCGGAGAPSWSNTTSGSANPQMGITTSATAVSAAALSGTESGVTANATFGVYGTTVSTGAGCAGVRGVADGAAGVNGVYGSTSSITATAAGVWGQCTGASGGTYGVVGTNTSSAGYGVYGRNASTAASGTEYGVYGVADVAGGGTSVHYGVYGTASNGTTNWAGYFASAAVGITAGQYVNWGATAGTTGYGLRDNAGTMEFKNSGGGWTAFSSSPTGSGTAGYATYWSAANTLGSEQYLNVSRGGTGAAAFTLGSVVFAGASGVYTQDNANIFWDDTNNRLGIGTTTPGNRLVVDVAANDALKITRDNTSVTTHIAKLLFANRYAGGENVLARIGIADGGSNKGLLIFEVKDNVAFPDSTTVEKMRIQPDGTLCVGTPTDANASVYATTSSTTAGAAGVYGEATGAAAVYGVLGTVSSSTTGASAVRADNLSTSAAGTQYGVQASVTGAGASTHYAVYGLASGGTNSFGIVGNATGSLAFTGAAGVAGSYDANNYGFLGVGSYGAYARGSSYGVYGEYATATTQYGYLGGASYGAYGQYDASRYGYIGGASYGAYGYGGTTTAGQHGVFGERGDSTNGTGYFYSSTMCAVVGRQIWGNNYRAGVQGSTYVGDAGNRTSGVIGIFQDLTTTWGSLAYQNSANANYGVYYTSLGNGAGFLPSGVLDSIGSGGYGGVMGGWVRGEVLGFTSAGELYASYNVGDEYTSGVQADVVSLGEKRVAVYSTTSTDLKVHADGIGQLSGGACRVKFDPAFAEVIAADLRPTVTVTSLGEYRGLYVTNLDATGFTVLEANGGTSEVEFTWIAAARRVDYAKKPALPECIARPDFDEKMKGVMFNENNRDRNATPIWWDGTALRFDAPPEPPRQKKPEPDPQVSPPPAPSAVPLLGEPPR